MSGAHALHQHTGEEAAEQGPLCLSFTLSHFPSAPVHKAPCCKALLLLRLTEVLKHLFAFTCHTC